MAKKCYPIFSMVKCWEISLLDTSELVIELREILSEGRLTKLSNIKENCILRFCHSS